MIFSITNVINSIAGQLSRLYPEYPVYRSPSFKTEPPCFYVFIISAKIDDEPGKRLVREIPFDVVFVQQRNVTDQNLSLLQMLEVLDEEFDMLTYTDGTTSCVLHCNERTGKIEDQELHYQFTIKQRISAQEIHDYMMTLEELDAKIKEYSFAKVSN